jgi:hypothetical protein
LTFYENIRPELSEKEEKIVISVEKYRNTITEKEKGNSRYKIREIMMIIRIYWESSYFRLRRTLCCI